MPSFTFTFEAANCRLCVQEKAIRLPASLPSGTPAGVPAGSEVRLRLAPFGPLTKIRKVLPKLAGAKLKVASTSPELTTAKLLAFTTFDVLPCSTANTDVTLDVPSPCMKLPPVILTACAEAQSPDMRSTASTTGARLPTLILTTEERLNEPNILLSPAVKVVKAVIVPAGPRAVGDVSGKAVPGSDASGASVPRTRWSLTTVTFVKVITASGIESPLLSIARVRVVATVLPGRSTGTSPVGAMPWQTVVTSLG